MAFTAPSPTAGTHELTAIATDASGNMSNLSPALTIVVDTLEAVVIVDSLATNNSNPPITGPVVDDAASLRVIVAGQTYSATNNGDGTWTLADDVSDALAEEAYDVNVLATDASGNASTDYSVVELLVDITPSEAPTNLDLVVSKDTGISSIDNLTYENTPSFVGLAEPESSVVLLSDSLKVAEVTSNSSGQWAVNALKPVDLSFYLGSSGSPVAEGYSRATPSVCTPSVGFGWDNGSVDSRDPGGSASALNRGFNWSRANSSFAVDVPNGAYEVTVTMGDSSGKSWGLWDLYLEGGYVAAQNVSGVPHLVATYKVDVADGQLTVFCAPQNGDTLTIQGLVVKPVSGSAVMVSAAAKLVWKRVVVISMH